MEKLLNLLKDWGIDYIKYDHEPLFTFVGSDAFSAAHPGGHCKNLFLRNKKGTQHYLLILLGKKRVDLRCLAQLLAEDTISFASPERLLKYLALTPGSVSPFGLINDHDHHVKVLLDQDLSDYEPLYFHPNMNTSTLAVSWESMEKYFQLIGNVLQIIKVPEANTDLES